MKKIVSLLLTILFSSVISKAQDKMPPVYQIKTDTARAIFEVPDSNWQILEDPAANLTIKQVSSDAFDSKFHINTTRTKGYNYSIADYWLRYRFKNELDHSVKITIPEYVAQAWLYIPQPDNTWKIQTTGRGVPWSQRDGLKRVSQFVLNIEPGQEIVLYERDHFDFTMYKPQSFQFTIGFADNVINTSYIDNDSYYSSEIVAGVILGFLLLASLINLLFYRIVKEKVYLYFSLFVLLTGLDDFLTGTDVFFREYPHLNIYVGVITGTVSWLMLMFFIRHFLSTFDHTPKWDKFLKWISILQIICGLNQYVLPPSLSFNLYIIIVLACLCIVYTYIPIILATMLFYSRKNIGPARVGIIAVLPGFAWWGAGYVYSFVCNLLHLFLKTPYPKFYNWLVAFGGSVIELFCFLWLVVVFSGILFNRFRDMQRNLVQSALDREIERSQLIAKQNEELEEKVALRTAELSTANRELSEQQEEITAQRDQLSETVEELKTTQQQLIQSEKLASLGELTAGIAHEIQNPLNFVNNFSEVSMELAVEMKEELKNGRTEDAIAIADDIEQNLEKIIHHGKRADAIVKNMLQHSRNNSAEKQLTDINALADEYLRLSYHGLRAKDKSFNSDMVADLDPAVPKVVVIPQDIGRVLLNLFNNAFYAVQQRKLSGEQDYKPQVKVGTKLNGKFVEIKVTDNGIGIPDSVKGKILQPFFTTKPPGEGTGLGLSLSYDILIKGHGGTMDIDSKEGEYTEFTIRIPA